MFLPVIRPMFRVALKIFSIVIFVLTILSAYSGRLNPANISLTSLAILFLPYLGLLTAVLTLGWFLARRWFTAALGVATLIAVWAPLSSASPVSFSRNPEAGKDTFTVLSWNFLHGEDLNTDMSQTSESKAIDYILEQNADIVCLQELIWWDPCDVPNLTPQLKDSVKKIYPYSAFEPHVDNHIFSKYPVKKISARKLSRRVLDMTDEGYDRTPDRYTFYEISMPEHKLLVVNVHLLSPGLSQGERNVFTDMRSVDKVKEGAKEIKGSITKKIQNAAITHDRDLSVLCRLLADYEGPVLVCGDFNDVPESWAWRIMTANGFKDSYQDVGFGPMITYNRYMFWMRLDYIFYRGPLRPLNLKKGKIRTSDHFPLLATFQFT